MIRLEIPGLSRNWIHKTPICVAISPQIALAVPPCAETVLPSAQPSRAFGARDRPIVALSRGHPRHTAHLSPPTRSMQRLAVFVSGGGSNFKAIHKRILEGTGFTPSQGW